jgi:hypothetical protein
MFHFKRVVYLTTRKMVHSFMWAVFKQTVPVTYKWHIVYLDRDDEKIQTYLASIIALVKALAAVLIQDTRNEILELERNLTP